MKDSSDLKTDATVRGSSELETDAVLRGNSELETDTVIIIIIIIMKIIYIAPNPLKALGALQNQ